MPNLNLSEAQVSALIAFLTWVSHIDNQGWPPRPILVTAASPQGIVLGTPAPDAASDWPLEDPKGQPIERVRAIRDEIRARIQALLIQEDAR